MSKLSMRLGSSARLSAFCNASPMAFEQRFRVLKPSSIAIGEALQNALNLAEEPKRIANGFRTRLQHAEALFEGMFGVVFHQIKKRALAPALRREDLDFVARAFRQRFLQKFAVLEIRGDMDGFRQILRLQIELL